MLRWLLGATLIAATIGSVRVSAQPAAPFVGCASDGQMGPVAAPKSGEVPVIDATATVRLAYYGAADHIGVFAPRGWHCFELYGSNGSTLLVTPQAIGGPTLLAGKTAITGPGIQLSLMNGGTSGRFEVAKIAARIFPSAKSFVDQVIDEGVEPSSAFPFQPFRRDKLKRRGDTVVEFTTPANSEGLGTQSRLKKSDQPIAGVAILLPNDDMDLVLLDLRLPAGLRDLAPDIIMAVEADHGDAAR